ncbi:MAG: hypothetical protein WCC36_08485, partial [Gammaproteobacteria bacterium]
MDTLGTSPIRVDGVDKVRGAARYIDDIDYPGMLYGATVRTRNAGGRLAGLHFATDFDWSDVVVVTAADIPGENCIKFIDKDHQALASGTFRHAAEAVALVAHPDRRRLAAALAAIE